MNMEYKTAKRMECLPFSGIRAVMEKANKMQQAGEKIIQILLAPQKSDSCHYRFQDELQSVA